ncbi:DUF4954 family protein [Cyclobacterium amurskyense]|uniref:DUF4954 domain-containing protein n=1 Tax=Cyclobacterium amurskyense TaxID=320787 RepID=A0A0H4PK65_9BACT|nr:DUF4954 family protein [Cyclobacterium amurskyense]AKP53373.1 hypothetical protein CA2015_4013 [Cyclobacterium amurskyense]
MNKISRHPLSTLGYKFIDPKYLPEGADEYYLRNKQNRTKTVFRNLNASEIEQLVRNQNQADDWNKIFVSDAFNPELVKNCKFFGLVRIGKLEPFFLEYHNLRMPVGLYNSHIISCDIGDNVIIDNVNYLSHYIIGDEVVLVNINEMSTTSHAKFGNGIVKEGESEEVRIWLELCNENGGRKVAPFSGMLPGDAWMWSRHRTDTLFQSKLLEFTQNEFDVKRGYYGKVGNRCIIKNTLIIKDVWFGSDAYIKGANKLKNLTIHSTANASTQIGESCELVNGIVSEGCTIFYGVKAVRFLMAAQSQLKYGARLINSYLGSNATISCCEVLNSLIFPSHEQHHNNSFLCAALIQGQSNMAAGATVGSNHNSRGADGEIIAGRGFWPGLCVSLKHNSRLATFTIVAKGDYPAELDIPLPFSLISNDVTHDELVVMPAYWFQYNMYALSRNAWKYKARDKRIEKFQRLEFDFLAPDSMVEVLQSIPLMEELCGRAYFNKYPTEQEQSIQSIKQKGKELLSSKAPVVRELDVFASGWENSKRKIRVIKIIEAYTQFKQLIQYYPVYCLTEYYSQADLKDEKFLQDITQNLPAPDKWINLGGQLVPKQSMDQLIADVKEGVINSWKELHDRYKVFGNAYEEAKTKHAFAIAFSDNGINPVEFNMVQFQQMLEDSKIFRQSMSENIYTSRKKDYDNPFRNMVYADEKERDAVLGALEDNGFIQTEKKETETFIQQIDQLLMDL